MISCNLMGGLGNQLFQIAAALAYSLQYDIYCIFPYSEELTIGQPRPTYWNTFLLELKPYTTHCSNHSSITNTSLFNLPKYNEPSFQYRPIPQYNDFMLHGYFQSYKYFEKYQSDIFNIIRIEAHQYTIKQEYPQYFAENNEKIISIHFRLGDYKHKQEFHPVLPYEYYEKSLQHLLSEIIPLKELKEYTILYCCEKEDNEHCLNIIHRLKDKFGIGIHQFMKVDDEIDDWKQLLIMSCCKINIIANSSFSWWAAYCNSYKDKVVIYPSIWFGYRIQNNVNDMYPPDWIKITI